MADETFDPHEPPRRRIPAMFWLTLACVFFVAVALVLLMWVPGLERRRALEQITKLGGRVYSDSSRGSFAARVWNGISGSSRNVVGIDLSAAQLRDEQLQVVLQFPQVESLTVSGPKLTDEGIRQLRELPELRRLVLVNCPRVSKAAEDDLRRANPDLRIARRGPALLGISGRGGLLGCVVEFVRPGTGADRGGLLPGDEILSIDGKRVRSFESLANEIGRHRPGDVVSMQIVRRGRRRNLTATLGRWSGARR